MKRILASGLALLLIAVFFSSCGSTPALLAKEENRNGLAPLPFPKIEKVGITLPNKTPVYEPEQNAWPLLSIRSIYATCVTGELAFINKEKKLIPMPKEARRYCLASQHGDAPFDWYVNPPKSIMLFNEHEEFALMRMDGRVVTDFAYSYSIFGSDTSHIAAYQNYVLATKLNAAQDHAFYGVLDAKTGEEVVPFLYDSMVLLPSCVYAVKVEDGENHNLLLDYTGMQIFDFGNSPVAAYGLAQVDFEGKGYFYDWEGNALYTIEKESDINAKKCGNYYVLYRYDPAAKKNLFTIANQQGKNILTQYSICDQDYGADENSVPILYDEDTFTTINAKGDVITLDQKEAELRQAARFCEPFKDQDGKVAYFDEEGRECISSGKYYHMFFSGDFLLATKTNFEEAALRDVFDKEGNLLLESAYGVIWELPMQNGIIVYKDADTCGVLHLDGSFEPIPAAGKVGIEYIGG